MPVVILTNVLAYSINDNYSALLCSLTDSLEIVDRGTLQLLQHEPDKLAGKLQNYYSQKFPADSHAKELMLEQEAIYHRCIVERKKNSYVSFIV